MGIRKVRQHLSETADGRPADAAAIFKSSGDYRQERRDIRADAQKKIDAQKEEMDPKWVTDPETGVKTKSAKQKVDRKTIRQDKRKELKASREEKRTARGEERDAYKTAKQEGIKVAKDAKGSKWITDPETGVKTKQKRQKLDRKAIKAKAAETAAAKIADNRKAKADQTANPTTEEDDAEAGI
jgi:hypothetical protein